MPKEPITSNDTQVDSSASGVIPAEAVKAAAIEAEHFLVKPGRAEEHERFLKHSHGDNRIIFETAELWARHMQYEKKQNPAKPFNEIARETLAECMPKERNRNPTMMMGLMVGHLNKYWASGAELGSWLRMQGSRPVSLLGYGNTRHTL